MTTAINNTASASTASASTGISTAAATSYGFASLGQKDFITMLTAELKQQDPFNPVDQKDMLAQMAQFSSLAGINTTNTTLADSKETLSQIAAKLDRLIAAQLADRPASG